MVNFAGIRLHEYHYSVVGCPELAAASRGPFTKKRSCLTRTVSQPASVSQPYLVYYFCQLNLYLTHFGRPMSRTAPRVSFLWVEYVRNLLFSVFPLPYSPLDRLQSNTFRAR